MSKYPRPTKQFDFIGKKMSKLGNVQSALLRRTDFRGTTFDDGVGAQSKEFSEAMRDGEKKSKMLRAGVITEIKDVELDWENAEGYEFTGPTNLTLTMEGMDLLKFTVGSDHTFELYSNTRNMIDVRGKLEKIKSIDPEAVETPVIDHTLTVTRTIPSSVPRMGGKVVKLHGKRVESKQKKV